jgi:alcohol dehydrogenase class IV
MPLLQREMPPLRVARIAHRANIDSMKFEFATATKIVFGPGVLRESIVAGLCEAGRATRDRKPRAFIVTGHAVDRAEPLLSWLAQNAIESDAFPVAGEPTIDLVQNGAARARDAACDVVIGFGGGSAIDAAKAIAALVTNTGDIFDYLEIIGRGQPLAKPSAPCIAIPTTAGTGAEVTRNAVLASPQHRQKVSLRSPHMLPKLALVDPELTLDLPPAITAATGLDALTQLIEPYVSCRANPLTDALCVEGIRRAARSLRRSFENGRDLAAREDMSLASLFSGLALANAGLGAVHGFAAPIGGMFPAPHGAVCAALLPHVIEINVRALRTRAPGSGPLRRYDEIARLLIGSAQATACDGTRWVAELCEALAISPLRKYGVSAGDIPALVEKGSRASSMKANPIPLTGEELAEILARAI